MIRTKGKEKEERILFRYLEGTTIKVWLISEFRLVERSNSR